MSHRVGKELYDAIEINDIERVRKLLDQNIYMYYENPRNARITGMELACSAGHLQIIKALVHKGYNINRVNKEGATAIFYALFSDNDPQARCLEYLVLHNADVNIRDSNGLTPLHLSIMHNLYKQAMILLNNGAIINIPASELNLNTLVLCMPDKKYLKIFPLLLASNYWVFQNVKLESTDEINIIRNKTLYLLNNMINTMENINKQIPRLEKDIDSRLSRRSSDSPSIFKRIKINEIEKDPFINKIYTISTYHYNIIYNLSMIHIINRALSEGNEYMIIACQEALSTKPRSKDRRLKDYAAIRCIGKIVELKEKLKFYEKEHNKTLAFMKRKQSGLINIGNIVNTRCNQIIARPQPNPT